MAKATVFIPDGDFCSDNNHLGCVYEQHELGFHSCSLYKENIGKIHEFLSCGELRRAYKKCSSCKLNMKEDTGNGIIEDK